MDSFVENQAWISGPDFLTKSADSWPENPDHLIDLTTADPEIKKNATIIIALEEKMDVMQ